MNDRHAISPYPVRMPHELREQLEESARKGSRSLHAEIISRLTDSFTPRTLDDFTLAKAAELDRDIARLSIEGSRYSKAMESLLKRARAAADAVEEEKINREMFELAEAFGKLEREKFQKMMQREMLDN
ncbi:Arc family DNA-binding protein [Pseudomonas protegens]|uniref:Arc family DNA-binding protein n=1 Tax=Pseudomonas protegens TaxID=380021 RepID=UPI00383B85B3